LDLPLGLGFAPGFATNKSANFMLRAATIISVVHPAWHFTSARPSSPCETLKLARRSSCAGQRADHPFPDLVAPGNLLTIVSTGVTIAPFLTSRLPAQPSLQLGHRIENGSPLAVADADTWHMSVLRQLPQVAGRDSEGLRCFAGAQGQWKWTA
jgi:hypothetical protein